MRWTARRAGGLLAVGVLAVGLGACGDDDGDDGDESGAGEGAETLSGDAAAEDAAAFCDAAVAVDEAILGLNSGEGSPDEVEQRLTAVEEAAPSEVADATGTMADEARKMIADADAAEAEGPPPMPGDAFYPASAEVSDYLSANCDLETVDVTATNYAYAGIPGTVPAGTTVINLANEADEFHEIVLMQIAEGEERSLEELMALPEEEAEALVSEKGFVLAPPGAETYVTAELEPGRYVAICFVPVGATPEALASGAALDEADGHFMHGMVSEFEVS